jgi:hypothetical protein
MANLKTEAGRPKIFSSDVDKDATPEENYGKPSCIKECLKHYRLDIMLYH